MGQYHYLVNLDKKQVIHPHQIGNGMKLKEQVGWEYSTATALVMLLASATKDGARGGGDFRCGHPLVGSWAGDRVAFVGDYAEARDIPGFDATLIYREADRAGNLESSDPPQAGGNGWTNISAQVRDMISAEFNVQYSGEGWLEVAESQGE